MRKHFLRHHHMVIDNLSFLGGQGAARNRKVIKLTPVKAEICVICTIIKKLFNTGLAELRKIVFGQALIFRP